MPEVVFLSGSENIPAYQKGSGDKAILLIHDVFGYQYEEMRRVADLFADNGFNVLLPDLYRGNPRKLGTGFDDFTQWLALHPSARVMADIKSAREHLKKSAKKVGIVGFCWGGLQVFNAAQTGLFDSAVDFYGSRMDTASANKIACPFFGIFGGKDPSIPFAQIHALEAELKKAKKNYQIKVFKDCGHAFVQKREGYNESASKEALADAVAWFKKTL